MQPLSFLNVSARVGLLILGMLAVSACSTDDELLSSLLDELIAEYAHPDLQVESRLEQGEGEGLLGKPVQARVNTRYRAKHADVVDEVIEDILSTAIATGWEVDQKPSEGLSGGKFWAGTKELPVGVAVISVGADPHGDDPLEVTIRLSFAERS